MSDKQKKKDERTVGVVRRALKSQKYGQSGQWEFDPVVGSQTAETSKRRHREGNERGGFSTDGK